MKFQYASDLHLELEENRRYIESGIMEVSGDVLLLCGDTYTIKEKIDSQVKLFLKWCSDNYKQTFLIPGNHEYYEGCPLIQHSGPFKEELFSNVHLVNNISERFNNVELFFTTLWTHIDPDDGYFVQKVMNDYRNIRYQKDIVNPAIVNHLHEQSTRWLRQALAESSAPSKIIVTHHCPVDSKEVTSYVGKMAYPAYCVDMTSIINECSPNYWIHGHTHSIATNDIVTGTTIIKTNPLGYVDDNEHINFNPKAYIEIKPSLK